MSDRVIIRGFGDGVKIFEDELELEGAPPEVIDNAAAEHMLILTKYDRSMLEFEFPDAPESERFLRIGNDSSLMVMPVVFKL